MQQSAATISEVNKDKENKADANKTFTKPQKKRKKGELSDSSASQSTISLNNSDNSKPETFTSVMSYALSSLNNMGENPYGSPVKTVGYIQQPGTSTPIYQPQYVPPPQPPMPHMPSVLPIQSHNAMQQQPIAHQSSDVNRLLTEVLTRLNGLDTKLARLDDIDKKLLKLDTVSANVGKLSNQVECLHSEVQSVKKRLDDVEKSSDFVSGKIDDVMSDTTRLNSEFKSFVAASKTQTKILHERIVNVEAQNTALKTEMAKLCNEPKKQAENFDMNYISAMKKENDRLKSSVFDLQCQNLSDNLVFTGIAETTDESTNDIIKNFIKVTQNMYSKLPRFRVIHCPKLALYNRTEISVYL